MILKKAGLLFIVMIFASSWSAVALTETTDSEQLHALFDEEWSTRMKENPLSATRNGVSEYNDLLPSVTPEDYARRLEQDQAFLSQLQQIDRSGLTGADQVNYDIFEFVLHHRVTLGAFRDYRVPLLSDAGFHIDTIFMARGLPMRTVDDYTDFIGRLNALPAYFDQNIENMRAGMKDGFTMPSEILPGIIAVLDEQQWPSPEATPFYRPFTSFPETFTKAEKKKILAAGRKAIGKSVIPAYRAFRTFMVEEYTPAARNTVGASSLPDGEAYYAALVKYFTNIDISPEEVHQLGLREVERIRAEMDAVIEEVEYDGDFAAFLEFLRTDPQFYAQTPEELLKEAAYISKQADGILPAFFGKLPRMPYSVQPVPAELAPNYTGGRYSPPPSGGTRGGEYWVNTYRLDKRPLYVLTALTLHEAVPGHHLQHALAVEVEDVPSFRLSVYPHAFGEGWGLYSEKLGKEMGLYKTPYDEFGRLTYEMWRACRLVVDTGIHSMGWSRQQALDYLASNTALSLHEVRTEIDRYIAWPGQALAYKMGELKILELREKARVELGDKYDIRDYHDAVIANGGIPLSVMERQIDDYIARKKGE